MSTSPEPKFKQALLPFKTYSNKKRKLEEDVDFAEAKCRKTHLDDRDLENVNQNPSNDSIDCTKEEESTEDASMSDNDTSFNDSSKKNDINQKIIKPKKLTPKQLQKKQEANLRRIERERLKQEKERKRQEEKDLKEKKRLAEIEAKNEEKRLKEEEKKAKEEERKAKEEERKAKEEEKKMKALAKEEERRQKEEEKRQKEEERKQKEEEKKQKEEVKRLKEEQEKKNKEKTVALFTNFFLRSKSVQPRTNAENTDKPEDCRFMPFEIKADMKLADICRITLNHEKLEVLDKLLKNDIDVDKNALYLAELKSKDYKPGHSENTWPLNFNEDTDDVVCFGEIPKNEIASKYRVKLIQFCENRRPAYWGTWRKRSKIITGRTPFKCDSTLFEYEIDSDDEWVEEPGESLHGSDDEKESEDEYEVDNDLFVPHGYLSDEEGQNDEILEKSPKSQKLKLNLLEKQFEAEMQEKTSKLKPRIYGCIWISNSVTENQGSNDVENLLLSFKAVWDETRTPFSIKVDNKEIIPQNTSVKSNMKSEFPDSLISDLIKLVHGNKNSSLKLSEEFKLYALNKDVTLKLSKSCITNKIKEISSWIPNNCCWIVNDEVRNQYNLMELSHQENTWNYISNVATMIKKSEKQTNAETTLSQNASVQTVTSPTSDVNPKSKKSSITKFVKVLTPDEMQKQLNSIVSEKKIVTPSSSGNSILNYVNEEDKVATTPSAQSQFKKRAVLFPVDKNNRKLNCDVTNPTETIKDEVTTVSESKSSAELQFNNETANSNEKSIFPLANFKEKETNDRTQLPVSENILRLKQGKKYAKLITIEKPNKK